MDMKITIYELLGLIREGKAPKKIKITGRVYEFNENYEFYYTKSDKGNYEIALGGVTGEINLIANPFYENVEIIEDKEKEIEELEIKQNGNLNYYIENEYGKKCFLTKHSKIMADKINELIKVVNELKGDKQ